ncbi:uncharacterized protein BDV17DRAFT_160308 [Aspergillus undulatus]|uniref:uncharacterized protein n=1 Tax=Aspergillus undulatus TaxID=1810928 RepID=UPI003CCCFFF2
MFRAPFTAAILKGVLPYMSRMAITNPGRTWWSFLELFSNFDTIKSHARFPLRSHAACSKALPLLSTAVRNSRLRVKKCSSSFVASFLAAIDAAFFSRTAP